MVVSFFTLASNELLCELLVRRFPPRSAKRPLRRAKRKAPAFHCIFKYARQSLASSFDIARRYAEQTTLN
jgi:hypothetical protein